LQRKQGRKKKKKETSEKAGEEEREGRALLSSVREIETLEEIFMVKNRESRES